MAEADEPDPSLRFSLAYLREPALVEDSARARARIAALFQVLGFFKQEDAVYAQLLQLRAGIKVPERVNYYDFDGFFEKGPLRDVLDAITVIFQARRDPGRERAWARGVSQIFVEEGLAYVVNAAGGVRRTVDKEFDRNLSSTIEGLGQARYTAVRGSLDDCLARLSEVPPANRQAIRASFDAAETLFRLAFPKAPRLGGAEIKVYVEPVLGLLTGGNPTAHRAAQKMANAFSDWVDAAHFYRHAQGVEEPDEPPLGFTVLLVSTGISFVRWLGEIDGALLPKALNGTQLGSP